MDLHRAIATTRLQIRAIILALLGVQPIRTEYDPVLGIPIMDYGTRQGTYLGRKVNPLHLALYACKELNLERVTGPIPVPRIKETENPEYVQRAVSWLITNQRQYERINVWEYDFPWPSYRKLQPPWRSALTEAFGALVLLVTGQTENARKHLRSMLTDYEEGGVARIRNDSLWFLEYACPEPPLVLNGMLHCLLILHESMLRLNEPTLRAAFGLAYKTLKRDLHLFDAGFYTYYDSNKNPADEKYHGLHVDLLHLLYERTNDREILPWIARWKRYRKMYPFAESLIFAIHFIRSKGSLYS